MTWMLSQAAAAVKGSIRHGHVLHQHPPLPTLLLLPYIQPT